jgi:hypothetical protein
MTLYGDRDGAVRPAPQVAIPRSPPAYSTGATMQVVARCDFPYSLIPGRTRVSAGEKVPDTSGFRLPDAWEPDFGAAEGEKLVKSGSEIRKGVIAIR